VVSEYDYDEDYEDDDSQRSDAEWAKLRRTEKARKQAEQKAADAQRELAFYKAGISPEDKAASYFIKGYEGDLSAEAIRAAAEEAGFLRAAPAGDEVDQTPIQTEGRIDDAASGAVPVDTNLEDVVAAFNEGGVDSLVQALKAAGAPVNDVQ